MERHGWQLCSRNCPLGRRGIARALLNRIIAQCEDVGVREFNLALWLTSGLYMRRLDLGVTLRRCAVADLSR